MSTILSISSENWALKKIKCCWFSIQFLCSLVKNVVWIFFFNQSTHFFLGSIYLKIRKAGIKCCGWNALCYLWECLPFIPWKNFRTFKKINKEQLVCYNTRILFRRNGNGWCHELFFYICQVFMDLKVD